MNNEIQSELIQTLISEAIPDGKKDTARKIINDQIDRLKEGSYYIAFKTGDKFKFVTTTDKDISIQVTNPEAVKTGTIDVTWVIDLLKGI